MGTSQKCMHNCVLRVLSRVKMLPNNILGVSLAETPWREARAVLRLPGGERGGWGLVSGARGRSASVLRGDRLSFQRRETKAPQLFRLHVTCSQRSEPCGGGDSARSVTGEVATLEIFTWRSEGLCGRAWVSSEERFKIQTLQFDVVPLFLKGDF